MLLRVASSILGEDIRRRYQAQIIGHKDQITRENLGEASDLSSRTTNYQALSLGRSTLHRKAKSTMVSLHWVNHRSHGLL